MELRRLRRRLFGYKKADVFDFISEVDEKAAESVAEKEREIEELKARIAEFEADRDAVVSVLKLAEKTAKELVDAAREQADNMRREAETEIAEKQKACDTVIAEKKKACEEELEAMKKNCDVELTEKKSTVNREIDIKRKAIKNYYETENKKIDRIKNEVERMRKASMDAIQSFERQLREVERMSENSSSYLETAENHSQTDSVPEVFADAERDIPVHIIESISE